MSVRKSSFIFGAVVVSLLIVCVGLLIALLKNQPDKIVHPPAPTPATPTFPTDSTSVAPPDDHGDYRLSDDVLPLNYDVLLDPDLQRAMFMGTVEIEVNVTRPVDNFTVHVHFPRLKVLKSWATDPAGNVVRLSNTTEESERDFHIMHLEEESNPGIYKLHYEFRGNMSGTNVGFYRSSYTKDGETRYLAASKFQPTYARRAFPCFDEPKFKSKFQVTLVHDQDYAALSNMLAEAPAPLNETRSGKMKTVFNTSVEMVTYLACFIVSDFKSLENVTGNGETLFRVFATPQQVNKTKFALDTGIQILDYYEQYFNIGYPLPKLDMIAVPDFQSGAMENWGLITFRETNLLYDELESSPRNRQRVATVVSHELAHMWFGNLVTMKWWDDLWLNEGFASYIEYKGVHQAFPDWKMLEQILTEDVQPVMRLDATTSSHPIIQPVNNPDQITEIFDAISYNKGASVLRMLESFVSEETFRIGISNFLKKYEFGNADTEQLWAEINSVYEANEARNISTVMATWTKQMGFPVVTVTRNANIFTVKQKRFLTNPQSYDRDESPHKYVWMIPLFYETSRGDNGTEWLENENEKKLSFPDLNDDDWVKFNHNQLGYYLVNYEEDEWERFSKLLTEKPEALSAQDRSSLLFDAFMLAQAGEIKYEIPLNLAKIMVTEKDLTPWETVYSCLLQLGHLFPEDEDSHFKSFLRNLTMPLYRKLGWKMHSDHVDSLLQTTIVGLACYSGNKECKQEAAKKMKLMMENKNPQVPLALRNTLFHYAMEKEDADTEWHYLWDKYEAETSAQERIKLLYGMAHVKDTKLIEKLLSYSKDPSKIRSQDFYTVLTYVAGNHVGRDIVWKFVRDNWVQLVERFTTNDRDLGRAVKNICDYFNTEEKLKEMEEFFDEYPNAGAGARARQQALENVRNNIVWKTKHQAVVNNWLEENDVTFSQFRLNGDLVPLHYDLTLQPFLEQGNFTGDVTIRVKVHKRTKYIIVHSHLLDIYETQVTDEGEVPLPARASFAVPDNELWVTELMKPAKKDEELLLKYKFNGKLSGTKLVGFYRSSYKTSDGNIRYLATSQFQSTYARQAFPCFDEPQFKSTFTVHVVHEDGYNAISNMPAAGTRNLQNGWHKTSFKESVKMVTYLLAVIVSDFECTNGTTSRGVNVSVYARPDEKNRTEYALDVGIKTLDFFEAYFKVKYPLPKLDMVAVPDFQAGAMENWGLVTYRETLLLYDKVETSAYGQLRIDAVIGHELAHMWFGNLVTMKWWDDLWLNEGFASYMEYKSMDHNKPEWEVDAQFFFEDTHRVLIPDAVTTSHPIVQHVSHPDEISAIFDAISYSKGASVLRMLEFFLGTEVFKWGVTSYLEEYSFDNAVTADLWSSLRRAAHTAGKEIEVAKVMKTWTRQMGYPYINVTRISEDDNFIYYRARPRRFLINPHDQPDTASSYTWDIPLSYRTAENPEPVIHWIYQNETDSLVKVKSHKWVKFNSDSKGYYLVNYGDEWADIIAQLLQNHKIMTPSDRANLISDVFLLARAGLTPYDNAMNLNTYLKKERHFVPWETAKRSLTYLLNLLKDHKDIGEPLKKHLRELTKDALSYVGWDNSEDHLQNRLRVTLMELACQSESPECLSKTEELLLDWKDTGNIPSNLRALVFRYGMRNSGDEMWNHLLERYQNVSSSQMQKDLLLGMAFSPNASTIDYFLYLANERNDTIRDQDYFTVLSYIASNPVGLQKVWDYVRNNWEKLVEKFTVHNRYLGDAVKTICSHFYTEDRLTEMEAFFSEHPDAGAGERSRKDALQTVKNSIAWLKNNVPPLKNWLEAQEGPKPWHIDRLPSDVIPVHYDVKLHPHIDEGTFQGSVSIQVTTTEKGKHLLVHSHLLNVTRASLTKGHDLDGPHVTLAVYFPHTTKQYWVLEARSDLPPGDYTIHLKFEGSLLDKLVGFYRSSYTKDGKTKHLATTQFQSTFARQAFPCLDEPGFKSTFTVTLVHNKSMTAISNMPSEKVTTRYDGLLETTFQKSERMVTYLVAAIVCDFDSRVSRTKSGVDVRVYAPRERIDQVEYSLEKGVWVLEFFEEYFNIPYPLPKLDMIALPDFRAGAMENWGLITYREVYLLFDEKQTSPSVKFSIAMIIAHEIAHMWFGNLVTMEWWDDLWLNEGFATYMAYKCLAHDTAKEDLDGIGMFLLGELSKVLELDATWSSHPIVTPVKHPDEISAIFDSISYSKGASVLRKLENFLTEGVFQSGVRTYLKKYEYKNAKTKDLWEELTTASNGLNVTSIMDTWTMQMGYPVVTVIETASGDLEVNQTRFLLNPSTAGNETQHPSPYGYVWQIPIDYREGGTTMEPVWLNEPQGTLNGVPANKRLKLNVNHAGYYLVNYPEKWWGEWAKILEDDFEAENLTRFDRSNLLSDAFLLAPAGMLRYDKALDLTLYLKNNETEFLPWSTGKSGLLGVAGLLREKEDAFNLMQEYLKNLSSVQFQKLGWDDEPSQTYLERRLRVTVADLACRAELNDCIDEASSKLKDFLANDTDIPSAVRALVYRYGLANDTSLWEKLWKKYKETPSAQEKRDMLIGLAYIKDEKQLKTYLQEAKQADVVRTQDFFTVLNNVAANPVGLDLAWNFYRDEWKFLVDRYTLNDGSLGGSFRSITSHFTSQERLNEMEEFIKNHPEGGAGETDRKEALEIVEKNIQWSQNYADGVKEWLKKQQPTP